MRYAPVVCSGVLKLPVKQHSVGLNSACDVSSGTDLSSVCAKVLRICIGFFISCPGEFYENTYTRIIRGHKNPSENVINNEHIKK